VVILLDHARNAGIGSSCESRQRAPCRLLYSGRAHNIQAFAIERGGDVAPAGNGGKNFAVAHQYISGDAAAVEFLPQPLWFPASLEGMQGMMMYYDV
jgi:hypothetical protein